MKFLIRCVAPAFMCFGCATSFTGDAHVVDGRSGCEAKCSGQGMELAGMVYMGEYSDACVCAVPGQGGEKVSMLESGAAVAGGSAGVVMQMRRQQEQQQQQQSY